MKILTLTRGFHPAVEFGGPAIAGYEIARRLVERGHSVTVFTSNLRDKKRKLYPDTTERTLDGIRVVYLDSLWNYHYAAVTPAIVGYCRREMAQYDVVNVYGLREFMTLAVTRSARRAGVPYVLQPLGNLPRYSRSGGLKLVYDALFRPRLLGGAARVIGRSELEAKQIREFGVPPERVAIVPNGVDLDVYRAGSGENFRTAYGIGAQEKIVLYLGRLAAIKSVDLLIEAFAPLARLGRLVLAGPPVDQHYLARLQHRVAELGITAHVTFTGVLTGQVKVDAYHAADVFVLPSLLETYGLAAAEAIASGTPAIVTTGCGLAGLIHERVGLAVEHDREALGGAIRYLLTDDGARAGFARRCSEVAKNELGWTAAVDRLEEVLRTVVEERKAPSRSRGLPPALPVKRAAASGGSLLELLDGVLDEIAAWPVQGDEFFLDHFRSRIEYKPYLHTLRYLAKRRPQGRLLDVGTGSGMVALCAARMGLDSWALDHPRRAWMREWLEAEGVRFVEHDLSEPRLPLESDYFDVVVFQDVIEHLPYSSRAIFAEMRRILRPGGEVIVCTPNLTRIATRVKLLIGRTVHPPLAYFWNSEFPFPGHYREFTRKEIGRMLEWSALGSGRLLYMNRSSARRMWRLRHRLPVEDPQRLVLWRILAQLVFDVAGAVWRSLSQTVWAVGRKPEFHGPVTVQHSP